MHYFFLRYTTVAAEPIAAKSETQRKDKVQVLRSKRLNKYTAMTNPYCTTVLQKLLSNAAQRLQVCCVSSAAMLRKCQSMPFGVQKH